MDLFSKKTIKNLFTECGLRPLKKFGQNFLIDKKVAEKLLRAADLKKQDVVLEIGPGIGGLTQELAKRVEKVIAVEKDRKMIEILKSWKIKNIEIINEDILKLDHGLIPENYKIVANLPFYLVAPVIRKFLEGDQPQNMSLIVQKEVGQRICAKPPKMSILAVSVQFYTKVRLISRVSKKSFWPSPKVDSAIIQITPKEVLEDIPVKLFFKIVKAGFAHPRKQLINNLSKGLKINKEKVGNWLLKNSIQPSQRAETLDIEDWLNLLKTIKIN